MLESTTPSHDLALLKVFDTHSLKSWPTHLIPSIAALPVSLVVSKAHCTVDLVESTTWVHVFLTHSTADFPASLAFSTPELNVSFKDPLFSCVAGASWAWAWFSAGASVEVATGVSGCTTGAGCSTAGAGCSTAGVSCGLTDHSWVGCSLAVGIQSVWNHCASLLGAWVLASLEAGVEKSTALKSGADAGAVGSATVASGVWALETASCTWSTGACTFCSSCVCVIIICLIK